MRQLSTLRFMFAMSLIGATFMSANVNAAGFEKSVMWSGRYAGIGNAVVGSVQGSESLYFNPAGLAGGNKGAGDTSVNVSAIISEFKGPYQDNVIATSDTTTTLPFGITASYSLSDKLTIGLGTFASAGSEVVFNDVTLIPGFALNPDFKTSLQAIEFSIGAGYMVGDSIKVGAAWRAVMARGDFWAAGVTAGPRITSYQLSDLSDEEFAGFKVGAMYSPSKTWGVGLMWRSEFKFDMQGSSSGRTQNTSVGAVIDVPGSDATASVVLPTQYAIGGFYEISPNLIKLVAEYSLTQYSKNKTIDITATLAGLGPISDIQLDWKDQHNMRLGVEYLGLLLPVRAGYVYTSAVAVAERATPSLTPPGAGHTITLGTGMGFIEKRLMVNIAGEYTTVSGDVGLSATPAAGTYSAQAYAVHMGASYAF